MRDIAYEIQEALRTPPSPDNFTAKLGKDALGGLKYCLKKLGLSDNAGMDRICRTELIDYLARYLSLHVTATPDDSLEDRVERLVGQYLTQFRSAGSMLEYQRLYHAIAKTISDYIEKPVEASVSTAPASAWTGTSDVGRVPMSKVSPEAQRKVELVKHALESVNLDNSFGQAMPARFLSEFTKRLTLWAATTSESSRLEQSALRSLVFVVTQHIAEKRGYSSESLPAEVHEALKAGLSDLNAATAVVSVQAAYRKTVEALVHLLSAGVKGYREQDQRLFDLAGKFGRHCSQPNSPRGSGTPEFDYVLLRRNELVDFVAALEKPVGGVVTTLPGQAELFDIAVRCGRRQEFIHRVPGVRGERKIDCAVMNSSDVFKFAREMAKYQCAPATGEEDSHAGLVSERELALMREVLELRRKIDSLEAARIAYASEFPLTPDGEPDVGSIHANIRKLKKAASA